MAKKEGECTEIIQSTEKRYPEEKEKANSPFYKTGQLDKNVEKEEKALLNSK